MKINILGQNYNVKTQTEEENPKLKGADGFTERYSKEIVIRDLRELEGELTQSDNLEYYQKKVTRHEIIHAYLYESGLSCNSDWADNEEIVDWIAIQLPKIVETCEKVGAL